MKDTIEQIFWTALEYRIEYLILSREYHKAADDGDNGLADDLANSCEYDRGYILALRKVLSLMGIEFDTDYKVNVSENEVSIITKDKAYTVEGLIATRRDELWRLKDKYAHGDNVKVSEIVNANMTLEHIEKNVRELRNNT